MNNQFIVVMVPKREWRQACATQFVVVKATNKGEAIRLATMRGLDGQSTYFKKPTAELFAENHLYSL